jgi:hypothetical protein
MQGAKVKRVDAQMAATIRGLVSKNKNRFHDKEVRIGIVLTVLHDCHGEASGLWPPFPSKAGVF